MAFTVLLFDLYDFFLCNNFKDKIFRVLEKNTERMTKIRDSVATIIKEIVQEVFKRLKINLGFYLTGWCHFKICSVINEVWFKSLKCM